jgi:hypothetical protein
VIYEEIARRIEQDDPPSYREWQEPPTFIRFPKAER